jgi:hypothetical protein
MTRPSIGNFSLLSTTKMNVKPGAPQSPRGWIIYGGSMHMGSITTVQEIDKCFSSINHFRTAVTHGTSENLMAENSYSAVVNTADLYKGLPPLSTVCTPHRTSNRNGIPGDWTVL